MKYLASLITLFAFTQLATANSPAGHEHATEPVKAAPTKPEAKSTKAKSVEKEVIAELEVKHESSKIEVQVNPVGSPNSGIEHVSSTPAPTTGATTHAASPSTASHNGHTAASPTGGHETTAGVPAEKALGWLKNGNTRYVKGTLRNDGQRKSDRERLTAGQHPHTIVLSCSDSRVPPEVLFDQKLGEIFVVRTAGEALDNVGLASLEYAVDHLGPQLLLVLAHESCGAVKAAFSTLGGQDAGSPALNALVKDIHPRIAGAKGHEPSKNYMSEAKANAAGVAKDLVGRSKIIENKVNSGGLQIETAIYHLDSGIVEFF